VFTIKAALNDPAIGLSHIFRGALPFIAAMIVCLALLILFPPIATYLPRL